MQIDSAQFTKMMYAIYERFEPGKTEVGYRENSAERGKLTAPEAELVIAIAQLAVAADRVEDPDEQALFHQLVGHIYEHANIATSPPTLGPVEDAERRLDHLRSHATQLQGKPSAALAYSVAYILAISDMDLSPDEGEMLEHLREALALDEEKAEDLLPVVSELITPPE